MNKNEREKIRIAAYKAGINRLWPILHGAYPKPGDEEAISILSKIAQSLESLGPTSDKNSYSEERQATLKSDKYKLIDEILPPSSS